MSAAKGCSVTITKGEFERFYDEVLGRDWYIEDWNGDDEDYENAGDTEVLVIGHLALVWQGEGKPEPTDWITRRQLDRMDDGLALLRTWLARQHTRMISFDVPADKLEELVAFALGLGASTADGRGERNQAQGGGGGGVPLESTAEKVAAASVKLLLPYARLSSRSRPAGWDEWKTAFDAWSGEKTPGMGSDR